MTPANFFARASGALVDAAARPEEGAFFTILARVLPVNARFLQIGPAHDPALFEKDDRDLLLRLFGFCRHVMKHRLFRETTDVLSRAVALETPGIHCN